MWDVLMKYEKFQNFRLIAVMLSVLLCCKFNSPCNSILFPKKIKPPYNSFYSI